MYRRRRFTWRGIKRQEWKGQPGTRRTFANFKNWIEPGCDVGPELAPKTERREGTTRRRIEQARSGNAAENIQTAVERRDVTPVEWRERER